jgi:hypothetical protein
MRATTFAQDDLGREIAEMPAGQRALGKGEQFLFFGRGRDAGHGAGSSSDGLADYRLRFSGMGSSATATARQALSRSPRQVWRIVLAWAIIRHGPSTGAAIR